MFFSQLKRSTLHLRYPLVNALNGTLGGSLVLTLGAYELLEHAFKWYSSLMHGIGIKTKLFCREIHDKSDAKTTNSEATAQLLLSAANMIIFSRRISYLNIYKGPSLIEI